MTINEVVSLKEHITSLMTQSHEMNRAEFGHLNDRLEEVRVHLSERERKTDERMLKIDTKVDSLSDTITRWRGFIAAILLLAPIVGAILLEVVRSAFFGG
jgi:regulator of replication initiation timing